VETIYRGTPWSEKPLSNHQRPLTEIKCYDDILDRPAKRNTHNMQYGNTSSEMQNTAMAFPLFGGNPRPRPRPQSSSASSSHLHLVVLAMAVLLSSSPSAPLRIMSVVGGLVGGYSDQLPWSGHENCYLAHCRRFPAGICPTYVHCTASATAIVTLIQIRIRIEIQIHIQMAAGGGGITKLSSHRLQMTMGFTKANCPQCTEVK